MNRYFDGFVVTVFTHSGETILSRTEVVIEYRDRCLARLPMSAVTEDELQRIVGKLAMHAARGLLLE